MQYLIAQYQHLHFVPSRLLRMGCLISFKKKNLREHKNSLYFNPHSNSNSDEANSNYQSNFERTKTIQWLTVNVKEELILLLTLLLKHIMKIFGFTIYNTNIIIGCIDIPLNSSLESYFYFAKICDFLHKKIYKS